ncbi:hypothetical protein DQ392_02930 [Streptomyces reniochalinae]|uniref:Diacylglycerol kinase n=1 Tax=Streptomyces reniochalinae TaxID=2250578 RepID=A0A367F2W1_9ACTN|nr:hypothetical protein DQ392_02930 [Streptomyces reniochalinae]
MLVVVDPVARSTDGESVRIARDVLRAGSPGMKLSLPEGPDAVARALARRGGRRPVLVGNDRALLRAVRLLHHERTLEHTALSVVPVGNGPSIALARSLGLPLDAVSAARTVLRGTARPLDLLVDDEGEVVLGGLRLERDAAPAAPSAPAATTAPPEGTASLPPPWRRLCHSLARTVLAGGARAGGGPHQAADEPSAVPLPQRLRVVADETVLTGPDRPVTELAVRTAQGTGWAEVVVQPAHAEVPARARARTVTVAASGGEGFRYRPDTQPPSAPVPVRTWTLSPGAWHLVLPAD